MDNKIGFFGTFEFQLDEKKRLSIPSDFRRLLSPDTDGKINIYLKKEDRAIVVYSTEGMAELTGRYRNESIEDPGVRKKLRGIGSSYQRKTLDGQGRVMIPDDCIEYAHLNKDVEIVGVMGWFEVWAKEVWDNLPENIDKRTGVSGENE